MSDIKPFEDEIQSCSNFNCLSSLDGSLVFELNLSNDEVLDQLANEIEEPLDMIEIYGTNVEEIKNPCPSGTSFIDFRKDMTRITNGIYKTVVTPGTGSNIDLERCKIGYDFALFLESSALPFDSSLRNGQQGIVSVKEDIEPIPAIFMALETMMRGEEAIFILSSDITFGKVGCPPKIPPNADLLLYASIISVVQVDEGKSRAEMRIETFHSLLKKASKQYNVAKENVKKQNFRCSIDICLKWIKKLEDMSAVNTDDDLKRKSLLAKMHRCLCVCYNNIEKPEKTCITMRELEKLKPIHTDPKALYIKGRANLMLKNFDYARQCFIKAQRLDPGNEKISGILRLLEEQVEEKIIHETEAEERLQKFKEESMTMQEKANTEAEKKRLNEASLQVELEKLQIELVKMVEDMKAEGIEYRAIAIELRTEEHIKLTKKVCQQHGVMFKGTQIGNHIFNYIYRQ